MKTQLNFLLLLFLSGASARAGVLLNDAVVDGKTIGDWSTCSCRCSGATMTTWHQRAEHIEHGLCEVREFQREVRENLQRLDRTLAGMLIDQTQEIIDAIRQPPHHGRGEQDGDENDHE